MTGELYDVLVLGPVEATPSAEARLAAALAGRNGAPLTTIAQGLAEKNLSVGQSLDRTAAEALVHQLQSMGALTSIRRATPAFPLSGAFTPTPLAGFRATGTPISNPLHGLTPATAPNSGVRLGSLGQNPASGLGRSPLSSPGSAPGSGGGLRPLGSLRPESAAPAPAPAPAAARIQTNGLGHRVPTGTGFTFTEPPSTRPQLDPVPAPAPRRMTSKAIAVVDPVPPSSRVDPTDPFANPEAGVTNLELDRDRKPGESHRPSSSVAGASGLFNPKLIASKAASGLDLAGEKRSTIERCSKHGLLFDSRKSSACRKCLADGRAALAEQPGGGLRASPGRRALLGLLFALVLGFLPAAYYSRQVGSAEVDRLRTEQQELSRGPGSDTTIRRFEEIDELVAKSRQVNMRNTLIIWLAASGVLMVAWYRIT